MLEVERTEKIEMTEEIFAELGRFTISMNQSLAEVIEIKTAEGEDEDCIREFIATATIESNELIADCLTELNTLPIEQKKDKKIVQEIFKKHIKKRTNKNDKLEELKNIMKDLNKLLKDIK